ncbi:protein kinase [Actinoplanes sp. NPDC051494]|uniref:serine/threonine-protein kinase n=1 Tax=Actinoplanes sp. NPDC051494 TaxID=3363907 RepID=UPI0037B17549
MISPGVTLGGRYRLDERIAGGGMGDVWRGTDEVLGRTVAVKILLPALLDEPGFAERFRGEARTMATINHPGVVDVYDYGSDQQLAFLVMEYVEGDALSRTLSRVGRLTPARTMALVAQAADALQAAHANGIVHRDVKPGNLLVRPNGTLVLTDFGIARSALVGQLTVAGSVLGTASYISPEQASGAVATAASDVYALGVVAYQCLSGHRPFDGATPIEIAMKHVREHPRPLPADIPPSVRAIVDRAMSKDPGARWATASAMAAVARQAASSLTTQVHQPAGQMSRPHANGSAGVNRPQSGGPAGANRPYSAAPNSGTAYSSAPRSGSPYSGAPSSGPPGQPGSGAGHTPYPQMNRPVSGPQGARGAASVPPLQQPYGHPSAPPMSHPMSPGNTAEGSGSRQVLIVLAVVLALLVLLCAGVISFLVNEGNGGTALGAADQPVAAASYRLQKQAGIPHSLIPATEGRQTL